MSAAVPDNQISSPVIRCHGCRQRVGIVTFGASSAMVDTHPIDTRDGTALVLHRCERTKTTRPAHPARNGRRPR